MKRSTDKWSTWVCECGCQVVRKDTYDFRWEYCPDCHGEMRRSIFCNKDWPGCGRSFIPYVEYKGKWVQTWDDVALVDRLEKEGY